MAKQGGVERVGLRKRPYAPHSIEAEGRGQPADTRTKRTSSERQSAYGTAACSWRADLATRCLATAQQCGRFLHSLADRRILVSSVRAPK